MSFYGAPSPSGKAEVCKTSTPGSNPGGASNFISKYDDLDRRLSLGADFFTKNFTKREKFIVR